MWKKLATLLHTVCLLTLSPYLLAEEITPVPLQRTLCVWDLMGANGDNFSLMKDYRVAATEWGGQP